MQVTPQLVKELRERTGAGMMDCKRALVDSEYNARRSDCERAAELLGIDQLRDATLAKVRGRLRLDCRFEQLGQFIHTVALAS